MSVVLKVNCSDPFFRSVEFGARRFYFFRRQLPVLLEERVELLGRVADRLEAERGEALLEFRRVDDLRRLTGHLHNHLARRAGGRGEGEIKGGIEVRHTGFGEGRHLRDERWRCLPDTARPFILPALM